MNMLWYCEYKLSSAPLKHPIQIRQIRHLHDVPIEQGPRGSEVPRRRREQDVLDLPLHRLVLRLLVVAHLLGRHREHGLRDVEERELAEEALEALLLGRPVDLREL